VSGIYDEFSGSLTADVLAFNPDATSYSPSMPSALGRRWSMTHDNWRDLATDQQLTIIDQAKTIRDHDHYADKREGERDIIAKWNGRGRLEL